MKNVKYDTIAEKNFFFRNGIHVAGLIVLLNLIPFFGISATFTWDGSTSTSWNTGSNWVGGTVPGTNDNAAIPGGLVNYPVITSNVTIRNISVNSSGTGGKLTINAGTVNARRVSIRTGGIMTVTNGQLNCTRFSVAGSVTMSGGTILSSGTFSISNGGVVNQSNGIIHLGNNINSSPSFDLRIDAGGTFNQSGGTIEIQDLLAGSGIFNQTGSSALFSIDADWLMGTGSTFNATAGTVQFTDDGNQSNFASGTRQFCNIVIDNNVDPGFSNSNPSTIPISGNFTNNSNSFSNTANSTFTFNGSGNQTIYSAITNTNATFGNLVINKPAGIVQLLSNIYSSSNLTLTSGTFDLDIYRCNRSSNGGTLNVGANTFLLVGGTTGGATGSNFPLGFTSVVIASTSTVHYDGANQTVALYTYGNLALSGISGAVIKTMPSTALTIAGNFSSSLGTATSVSCTALSNFTIAGSFTIGTGTTFTGGVFIHSIAGNILITGTYISTSNKIILNGLLTQNVSSVSAFNKLVINKNTGMVNLNSNISLNDSIVFIKGNVRTTTFKVILNTTGKIGGASATTGWVFGTLQLPFATGSNITKTFDVGDSLKYSPAVLNITTVTIAGGVSAKVTGTDHPLISNSTLNAIRDVNRYWTFTNNGLGFNNCKITFNWLATDIDAGSTTSLFKVARYSGVWDTTAVLLPLPTSIQAT
ncbi:MAG TPA: hypothetical protein PKD91_14355, partial [Bacteroidia bacterium]|nr:hypothetical protein [Bacteroidia bacterium]